MTQLEKMIESCEEFAKSLKIGNIQFNKNEYSHFDHAFCAKLNNKEIEVFLCRDSNDNHRFYYTFADCLKWVELTATTAQEAAAEALELCRKQAQKLVELLGEPKDEKQSIFEIRKVLGQVKDSLQCSLKRESHLTEQVKQNHIRDLEKAIIILDNLK